MDFADSSDVTDVHPDPDENFEFAIDVLLKAIVIADVDACRRAQNLVRRLSESSPTRRRALAWQLETVLRSAWAAAIVQGSPCQRELLMDVLELHGELKAGAGVLVGLRAAPPVARATVVRMGQVEASLREWPDRSGHGIRQLVSTREVQVLKAVAEGMTNKQIGQHLSLSPNTIKRHMTRVMQRLGVSSRAALAVWYSTSEWSMAAPEDRRSDANSAFGFRPAPVMDCR